MREPELYKLATTVTCDYDIINIYTVTVGQYNELTSVDESEYEEKNQNSLISPGESISEKEPSKISEKKTMRLYIVPGAPTLFYQQSNHISCILSSLESALYYMGDKYASKYIIRRKKKCLLGIHNNGQMHFYRDILMENHREKNEKNSIIVLRNGIHPHHMIYFRISLLIQLFVFY